MFYVKHKKIFGMIDQDKKMHYNILISKDRLWMKPLGVWTLVTGMTGIRNQV